jgi:hypothetical protein
MDLTKQAAEGFESYTTKAANPYLGSSPSDIAFNLGFWLALTSRSAPRNVTMSRGYTIRANDMLMKWNGAGPDFERIN